MIIFNNVDIPGDREAIRRVRQSWPATASAASQTHVDNQ